jgi:hypothetical protein
MNTIAVDLYLARGYLRASISMLHFSRISDLFNNAPGEFLSGTVSAIGGSSAGTAGGQLIAPRESVFRLRDVLFVRPLETQARTTLQQHEHRDRLPQRMVLEVGDWRLFGDLHLIDSIRWIDFMISANKRFMPVTRARLCAPGSDVPMDAGFVLVNGQRVSALYEDG